MVSLEPSVVVLSLIDVVDSKVVKLLKLLWNIWYDVYLRVTLYQQMCP